MHYSIFLAITAIVDIIWSIDIDSTSNYKFLREFIFIKSEMKGHSFVCFLLFFA